MRTFGNHRAVVEAVANGNEDGWIMVDTREKPTSFFMHESGGFFFLHGRPNADFIKQISEHLYHDLKLERIEVFISDPALESVIPELFGNRKYKTFQRKVFHLNKEKFHAADESSPSKLPGNLRVQSVCEERSLSATIIADNDVATHCRAIIGVNEFEISIETAKEHRRKGYAVYAAQKLIKTALQRDMIPVWSCWSFNDASIGLAKKLGFEEIRTVTVYSAHRRILRALARR